MSAGKHHEIAWRHDWWRRRKAEAAAAEVRREIARVMGAIRWSPLHAAEKRVARRVAGLWLYWRRRGWIDPTLAELAAHCRVARCTVQRVLRKMEALGWIGWDENHVGGRGIRRRMVVQIRAMRDGLVAMIRRPIRGLARWASGGVPVVYQCGIGLLQKGSTTRARLRNNTPSVPPGRLKVVSEEGSGWFSRRLADWRSGAGCPA
jgi:hypothetical protein